MDTYPKIVIDIDTQSLSLYRDANTIIARYPINSAKNGCGENQGSGQTPRGQHIIRAKIGQGTALNTVFRARRPTGEIYSPELGIANPDRDWILTRILWLSGCETGKNRGGQVDTMRRYIYIHGTPDENSFSTPASHGCIRMLNADIVELFDQVPVYTPVFIKKAPQE